MGNSKLKKYIPIITAIAVLTVLALFSDTGLCLFRRVTGLPCPSCGMTRSYLAFFHLDFKEAFFMHPLFWTIPLIAGLFIYSRIKKVNVTRAYMAIGILFIIVYILRMVLYFPHTYPMDYDHSSILGRLFF